ncbi:hypothetical protein MY11210_009116, partial [Beauveria gryllotalpidicola]
MVSPANEGRYPNQLGTIGLPSALDEESLSLMQEEYFIELYWHAYHTAVFPILDEADFREHYRSLWTTEGNKLMAYELENPAISTLQCQMLCSVYLCCANFQNMSDGACGMVVRTAYMLGLHIDPPDTMPSKQREMRRRLWWAIYVLDSKIGMKYGRPFLLHQSKFPPRLPDHTLDVAIEAGSNFGPLGHNLSWLSFHYQQTKLFLTAKAAYEAFFYDGRETHLNISTSDKQDALEERVESFSANMKEVAEWAKSVPDALKTRRLNNGHPLSTDSCPLDLEMFAPLWLQRQRLLLELMYHNLCINLCRPFIAFCSAPASTVAEQFAISCALHAMTLTNIMHQVLSSTTILRGWQEAFQWQWNASMTLVGFVLAYPRATSTPDARRSIDLSLAVLDLYGNSFAVAARASDVVRRLRVEIDRIVRPEPVEQTSLERIDEANMAPATSSYVPSTAYTFIPGGPMETQMPTGNGFDVDEMTATSLQNILNMAFDVDQWAEPQMLWTNAAGF